MNQSLVAMARMDLAPGNPLRTLFVEYCGEEDGMCPLAMGPSVVRPATVTRRNPDVDVNQWRNNTAMLLSNRTRSTRAALCRIGDALLGYGHRDHAHFWYAGLARAGLHESW